MKTKLALLALLLCTSSLSLAKKSFRAPYVPGEIIVKLKPQKANLFYNQVNKFGKLKRELNLLSGHFVVLKKSMNKDMDSVLDKLNKNPNVEYAEPNFIYSLDNTKVTMNDYIKTKYNDISLKKTSDKYFSKLWGLKNTGNNEPKPTLSSPGTQGVKGADINALKAWSITKGDKRIKIAVIDTGVDYNHKDLKNNMWVNQAEKNGLPGVDDDGNGYVDDIHGYDFANKDGDPMDGNDHGTHCAGTIAAEHDTRGIAGVMADAQIVAVKFLTDEGSGKTDDAIAAVDYATKVGVDIMSNSWGGGAYSQALKDAIVRANNAGIIFTAAAGNSASNNNNTPQYPANYQVDNVISVAAHDINDKLADFSCFGSQTVHVAAPGENILSTTPGNTWQVFSGTSMATPHVSGVIGLYLARFGNQDPATLRDNLMKSSVYGVDYERKTISGGRVDAYNFLKGIETSRPAKPDDNAWSSLEVEPFQSSHPYPDSYKMTKTYLVPGAKFIRAVFKRYETEEIYDTIRIKNKNGLEVQSISGKGSNKRSEYVKGDTITIDFESDMSVNMWGFLIEELEVIQ